MNWISVIQYSMSGAIVSWPVFVAGIIISHRKTRDHVDEVTGEQTEKIAELTREQTRQLEASRHAGLHQPHPGGYHGHGDPHT